MAKGKPQVCVLVDWFLNVTSVLKVLPSWVVEMLGKGQGTPNPGQPMQLSGEAEHEPDSSSSFNSKSMTQFL